MKKTKGKNGGTLNTLEPGETLPGGGHPGGNNFKTIARKYLDSTCRGQNPLSGKSVTLTGLEKLFLTLLDKALKGDIAAAREILDRIEGKPTQSTDVRLINSLSDEQVNEVYENIIQRL